MISTNTYREKAAKLAKQIKKEHFLKVGLWIAGITLTLIWLAMVLATSISTGSRKILGETITVKDLDQINNYFADDKWVITNLVSSPTITATFRHIDKVVDLNPMCLTYTSDLTGWYICILLAPIGYMSCIYIIAYIKNMITPSAIKKTVRKALQFGYLKQKDVEYVVDEIDYNIGIKERPKTDNVKIDIKKVIEYEREQE